MTRPGQYNECICGRHKKIEAARCRSCWLRKIGNTQEAFWQRVERGDGCWNWTAGVYDKRRPHQRRGYFVINGRQRAASRLAWEWTYGPVPKGLFVCHKCDNPLCVRPDHLFLGTPQDNMTDMWVKGRGRMGSRQKTHCPHGHEYTPDNTITVTRLTKIGKPGQTRRCRTCVLAKGRRYNALLSAARKRQLIDSTARYVVGA